MPRSRKSAMQPILAALIVLAAVGTARGQTPEQQDAGAYATVCAACHQGNGLGVPGAFPPLAGHAPTVLARPGGRDYLARLVLYGLHGPITVDGRGYNGAMPGWGDVRSDQQLADALDHVLMAWGNATALPPSFVPFTAAEIAAARATRLTADQVYALRQDAPAAVVVGQIAVSFTQDQANRGHAAFRRNCQDCHGAHLDDGEFGGAPLKGGYFARHWGDGSAAGLYGYMHSKMPPDRPGKLNAQTYADLTAFLLASNGYQPGDAELEPDPDKLAQMSLKRP